LIAEDNELNCKVLTGFLAEIGCQVEIVGDGAAAVRSVQEKTFDIVLMDVHMPILDGVAATQAIRQLPGPVARIPIIAITADAMQGDREAYLAAGMDYYLSKPVSQKNLVDAISRCLTASARVANGQTLMRA